MNVRTTVRTAVRTAAGGALLAALAAPSAAAPAATDRDVRGAAPRTALTFTVEDCEGCEIQLVNARSTLDADVVHVWESRTKEVEDGSVTFSIPTRRTWGMSATVVAPWEGHTGYRTTVAWRYNGKRVGDPVTLEEAVTRTKASACWEGVRSRRVTVPLVVEKVRVAGVHEEVEGSIAFVPTTQSWLRPMREVWDGVLGSQDVNICH
ncbi:hypothetical protein ASC64_06395 [Nocardioides sp. Root122]|uniref:hypothetical protein n=1 Tax=Nocardioides TaxID=1839 RepID=UPI000703066F|nr:MULTISPECIES: hypothetical protein [Nocardioides]KQV69473.1 hypothetical protein ASC64_06395 [Nocardioides sp. Root122]MCK9824248.1 hypothetical protein [Nocardioides cavernae]